MLNHKLPFKTVEDRVVRGPDRPLVPPNPTQLDFIMSSIWNGHLTVNKLGQAMFSGSLSGYTPNFTFSSFAAN